MLHRSAFGMPSPSVVRAVDESVGDDVVHRSRFRQVLEQAPLAVGDALDVAVQASEERLPVGEQADVVAGDVVPGLDIAHQFERNARTLPGRTRASP